MIAIDNLRALANQIDDFTKDGIRLAIFRHADNLEKLICEPIPMLIHCPQCNKRHIDEGEFATKLHHTHACQECGHVWRPAFMNTIGVKFLPGFKNT